MNTDSADFEACMRRAIEAAAANPAAPFGAVLVHLESGDILARGCNQSDTDPTLHGEISAIRAFASTGSNIDPSRIALCTTAEPCPMCATAIYWTGIRTVVYGVSIPWLSEQGWRQVRIRASELFKRCDSDVRLIGGVLQRECEYLFKKAER